MSSKQWRVIRRYPHKAGGFVTLTATSEAPHPAVDEKTIISATRHQTIEDALESLPATERKTAVVHAECHDLMPFESLRFHTKTSEQFDLDEAREDIEVLIAQVYDLHGALTRAEARMTDIEDTMMELGD